VASRCGVPAARGGLSRAAALFGEPRLPSLLQYDPMQRYFETVEGELVFTAATGTPLIRYNIHDRGGLLPAAEVRAWCRAGGDDPLADRPADLPGNGAPDWPFVYLFGRSDFTVSYYGANVYPENVQAGLETEALRDRVTGKFVMYVLHDSEQRERLAIHIELAPGLLPDLAGELSRPVADAIVAGVRRQNSEFANYIPPEAQVPLIHLHASGDPAWFTPGLKHRYTRPHRKEED